MALFEPKLQAQPSGEQVVQPAAPSTSTGQLLSLAGSSLGAIGKQQAQQEAAERTSATLLEFRQAIQSADIAVKQGTLSNDQANQKLREYRSKAIAANPSLTKNLNDIYSAYYGTGSSAHAPFVDKEFESIRSFAKKFSIAETNITGQLKDKSQLAAEVSIRSKNEMLKADIEAKRTIRAYNQEKAADLYRSRTPEASANAVEAIDIVLQDLMTSFEKGAITAEVFQQNKEIASSDILIEFEKAAGIGVPGVNVDFIRGESKKLRDRIDSVSNDLLTGKLSAEQATNRMQQLEQEAKFDYATRFPNAYQVGIVSQNLRDILPYDPEMSAELVTKAMEDLNAFTRGDGSPDYETNKGFSKEVIEKGLKHITKQNANNILGVANALSEGGYSAKNYNEMFLWLQDPSNVKEFQSNLELNSALSRAINTANSTLVDSGFREIRDSIESDLLRPYGYRKEDIRKFLDVNVSANGSVFFTAKNEQFLPTEGQVTLRSLARMYNNRLSPTLSNFIKLSEQVSGKQENTQELLASALETGRYTPIPFEFPEVGTGDIDIDIPGFLSSLFGEENASKIQEVVGEEGPSEQELRNALILMNRGQPRRPLPVNPNPQPLPDEE